MGKKARARKKERRKGSATPEGSATALEPEAGWGALLQGLVGAPLDGSDEPVRADDHGQQVPVDELAARLAGLSTLLERRLARSDVGDGLTRARLSALALLVFGGPRTLGELAGAERVRPPTMTRLVHAMEADGLVERAPNPADGRSVIIRATARGERAFERGRARQIAPLAEGIAVLSGHERQRLEDATDMLGRLLRQGAWEGSASAD